MRKNILYYIRKFFEEIQSEGIKSALYRAYSCCRDKIFSRLKLPAPLPRRISLLRRLSLSPSQARRKALSLVGDCLDGSCSLDGAYVIQHGGEQDFSREAVVLLAHGDPENIVDPYVLHMAEQLRQLGKKIVLCSAAPLATLSQEVERFAAIVCRTCAGDDFTSWKAAFEAFPSLHEAREITLCHDRVFAPVGSYAPAYQKMASISCDFWGMTLSHEVMPHMQSFHLVLRERTLRHPAFKRFMAAVAANDSRHIASGYEVRFSLWLELHGLRAGCYRPYTLLAPKIIDPLFRWKKCLRDGIPLVKRDFFMEEGRRVALPAWQDEMEKYNYPARLINDYFHRIGLDTSSVLCPGKRSAAWPPSVFARYRPLRLPQEEAGEEALRTAAIVHCYYPEVFPVLQEYLRNLPSTTHIYISTDTGEKRELIQQQLGAMHFSRAEVRICPNKGWDIAPFLAGFGDIIPQYDLICKVHAKVSSHVVKDRSAYWRELLYGSLLGGGRHVRQILRLFADSPELGMLVPPSLPYYPVGRGENAGILLPLLQKMGIRLPPKEAFDFPVGSMFWARSAALQPLLDLRLGFADFGDTNPKRRDRTLAHAIERAFLFSCCQAGYVWGRISPGNLNVPLAATD